MSKNKSKEYIGYCKKDGTRLIIEKVGEHRYSTYCETCGEKITPIPYSEEEINNITRR